MLFTRHVSTPLCRFLAADSGAITVDWVVLSAAIVGLGMASVTAVRSGAGALGTDVGNSLSNASVVSLGELGSAATNWSFAPRVYDQSIIDANIAVLAGWTDAELLSNATTYANLALSRISSANEYDAAAFLDSVYMLHTVMNDRGLGWPSGVPTLQEIDGQFVDAFGA